MKRTQILALMTILCAIISVKCLATCDSSFTVTKNCLTTDLLSPDDIPQYEIIITNTGSSELIFVVDDLAAERQRLAVGDGERVLVAEKSEDVDHGVPRLVHVIALVGDDGE